MSFFENLSFLMGGDEQIPAQFRTSLSEYNDAVSSFSAMPAQPDLVFAPAANVGGGTMPAIPATPPPSPFPAGTAGQGPATGNAGAPVVRGGVFSREAASPFSTTFTQANPNTITVGQGGGLYGGNVTYSPSSSAYGSIDPSMYLSDKRKGASNLSAAVQRAQYQDYLNRFAPVENYLVGQVNGRTTQDLGFDLARANQSVINAGSNMQGQQERAMGRFGLQYRGASMANSNEITGGRVAAMNQARMADEERALSLVSGSGRTTGGQ